MQLNLITEASAAALIAAGLLSVILFPATGLALLRRGDPTPTQKQTPRGGIDIRVRAVLERLI